MKKKMKNMLKEVGYLFMVVVLIFGSMPIQTVRAEQTYTSNAGQTTSEDNTTTKTDLDKEVDKDLVFDEDAGLYVYAGTEIAADETESVAKTEAESEETTEAESVEATEVESEEATTEVESEEETTEAESEEETTEAESEEETTEVELETTEGNFGIMLLSADKQPWVDSRGYRFTGDAAIDLKENYNAREYYSKDGKAYCKCYYIATIVDNEAFNEENKDKRLVITFEFDGSKIYIDKSGKELGDNYAVCEKEFEYDQTNDRLSNLENTHTVQAWVADKDCNEYKNSKTDIKNIKLYFKKVFLDQPKKLDVVNESSYITENGLLANKFVFKTKVDGAFNPYKTYKVVESFDGKPEYKLTYKNEQNEYIYSKSFINDGAHTVEFKLYENETVIDSKKVEINSEIPDEFALTSGAIFNIERPTITYSNNKELDKRYAIARYRVFVNGECIPRDKPFTFEYSINGGEKLQQTIPARASETTIECKYYTNDTYRVDAYIPYVVISEGKIVKTDNNLQKPNFTSEVMVELPQNISNIDKSVVIKSTEGDLVNENGNRGIKYNYDIKVLDGTNTYVAEKDLVVSYAISDKLSDTVFFKKGEECSFNFDYVYTNNGKYAVTVSVPVFDGKEDTTLDKSENTTVSGLPDGYIIADSAYVNVTKEITNTLVPEGNVRKSKSTYTIELLDNDGEVNPNVTPTGKLIIKKGDKEVYTSDTLNFEKSNGRLIATASYLFSNPGSYDVYAEVYGVNKNNEVRIKKNETAFNDSITISTKAILDDVSLVVKELRQENVLITTNGEKRGKRVYYNAYFISENIDNFKNINTGLSAKLSYTVKLGTKEYYKNEDVLVDIENNIGTFYVDYEANGEYILSATVFGIDKKQEPKTLHADDVETTCKILTKYIIDDGVNLAVEEVKYSQDGDARKLTYNSKTKKREVTVPYKIYFTDNNAVNPNLKAKCIVTDAMGVHTVSVGNDDPAYITVTYTESDSFAVSVITLDTIDNAGGKNIKNADLVSDICIPQEIVLKNNFNAAVKIVSQELCSVGLFKKGTKLKFDIDANNFEDEVNTNLKISGKYSIYGVGIVTNTFLKSGDFTLDSNGHATISDVKVESWNSATVKVFIEIDGVQEAAPWLGKTYKTNSDESHLIYCEEFLVPTNTQFSITEKSRDEINNGRDTSITFNVNFDHTNYDSFYSDYNNDQTMDVTCKVFKDGVLYGEPKHIAVGSEGNAVEFIFNDKGNYSIEATGTYAEGTQTNWKTHTNSKLASIDDIGNINPYAKDIYCISSLEKIAVSYNEDEDVISNEGDKLVRRFGFTLSDYNKAQNEVNGHLIPLKAHISIIGTDFEFTKTLNYTKDETQYVEIEFDKVGTYDVVITTDGYSFKSNKEHASVKDFDLIKDGLSAIVVDKKEQPTNFEIKKSVHKGKSFVEEDTDNQIIYGQWMSVYDKSVNDYPGVMKIEEVATNKVLTIKEDNKFRVEAMNASAKTSIKIWKEGTEFYKATEPVVYSIKLVKPKVLLHFEISEQKFFITDILKAKASISISDDFEPYCKDLFDKDKNFAIEFTLKTPNGTKTEKKNIFVFDYIKELFGGSVDEKTATWTPFYSPSDQYSLGAKVVYDKSICPYSLPSEEQVKNFEIQSQKALFSAHFDTTECDYKEFHGEQIKLTDIKLDAKGIGRYDYSNIAYEVTIENPSVLEFASEEHTGSVSQFNAADTEEIEFTVNHVGKTKVSVSIVDTYKQYTFDPVEYNISVTSSALSEEDYVININGIKNPVKLADLKAYLANRNCWINKDVTISVSSLSEELYNSIGYKYSDNEYHKDIFVINHAMGRHDFEFWPEKVAKNEAGEVEQLLKTKENETLTIGVDTKKPESKEFTYPLNAYELTSNDEIKYYHTKEYVISGVFTDANSGISRIEYTTDGGTNWKVKESFDAELSKKEVKYSIPLPQGRYTGIAVKAIDVAGNVSEIMNVADCATIVVDATEPVISIDTFINGNVNDKYSGEWTNKNITIALSDDTDKNHFIAGIYKYLYKYVSIGKDANDVEWRELDKNSLTVKIGGVVAENDGVVSYTDKNGTYYFKAISNSGVVNQNNVSQRVKLQQNHAAIKEINVTSVGERKNEWYNKKSGVPTISFEYPIYDNGVEVLSDGKPSYEYDAPITLHYTLKVTDEKKVVNTTEKSATIGIDSDETFEKVKEKVLSTPYMSLEPLSINFGYKNGYAEDGIYELEYWFTDETGYKSEVNKYEYKIDTHEPEKLVIAIDGKTMNAGKDDPIVYEKFSQKALSGSAKAEYGVSGLGSLKTAKVKHVGDWKDKAVWEKDTFEITPNTRCIVYAIAEDLAGNTTEAWSQGVVVDNQAPNGKTELIIKPDGANKNGFYNSDINIKVVVNDLPTDDNYAGIKTVSYSLGKEGKNTFSKELFAFTKDKPSEQEIQKASKFDSVIKIDAKANESNNAFIEVTAIDRAENIKKSELPLKIDVTKPVISVTFDNMSVENGKFYKENRTATIHVTELNFDPSRVKIDITKNGTSHNIGTSAWTTNGTDNYATVVFSEDGDYTMTVDCVDLADNQAETVSVEPFTIDKTRPVVNISYDNMNAYKENYYNQGRTATITVTEHNFDASRFSLSANPSMSISGWTNNGDVHTTTISFITDNLYMYHINLSDLAGNEMEVIEEQIFYVDTQAPEVIISGVENDSANAGNIAPVVTVLDDNYDSVGIDIKVTTGRGDNVNVVRSVSPVNGGYAYALTDLNNKEDNIYYLEATGIDKAGNSSTVTYRFSLNRHGSTYDLTSMSSVVEKVYNRYMDMQDLTILEMNVDMVDNFDIYISNGENMLDAREVKSRPDSINNEICYSVEVTGNNSIGYTYTYTIYRENFAQEGEYNISFYSKDKAGNEVNSTLDEKNAEIHFVVDNTAPTVIIEGVQSNAVYKVDTQNVNVVVMDNCKLKEAEFYLVNDEGQKLQTWNYLELAEENEIASIEIPSYDSKLTLLYRAMDAAGNEVVTLQDSEQVPTGFLITTNVWTQFMNSKSAKEVAAAVIGVIAVAGTGSIVFFKRRKVKAAK